jgi:hypothetical protein
MRIHGVLSFWEHHVCSNILMTSFLLIIDLAHRHMIDQGLFRDVNSKIEQDGNLLTVVDLNLLMIAPSKWSDLGTDCSPLCH